MKAEVKMIAQGYKEGPMMFRVWFAQRDLATVKEALYAVGSYNEFAAGQVFRALSKVSELGLLYSLEFGREYSPVLYLSLEGGRIVGEEWHDYDAEEHAENVEAVRKAFRGTKHDEFSVTYNEKGVPQFRIWWD